jgi:plasmid stabilization system protein ParE
VTHRVRISTTFRADLRAHLAWLARVDEEAWIDGLRQGVDEAIALLGKHPAVGAIEASHRSSELRRLVLRRVPYFIWYAALCSASSDVWLLRIFHARQKRPSPTWPPAFEPRARRRARGTGGGRTR